MSSKDWAQLILGLTLPWILIVHLIANGYATRFENLESSYALLVLATWVFDTKYIFLYNLLLVATWVHGIIGIQNITQNSEFYNKNKLFFTVVVWIVPILSVLGYTSAGKELISSIMIDEATIYQILGKANFTEDLGFRLTKLSNSVLLYYPSILVFLFVSALIIYRYRLSMREITVKYADGVEVKISKGTSILEASRENSIGHISMCGGRGRCSTCRVRILSDHDDLPERNGVEEQVAKRLNLDSNVRLACQLRPISNITVRPLVSAPKTSVNEANKLSLSGRETEVVVMFIDLRNFTLISEKLLPYDTVFLLNKYFKICGEAIAENNGNIDKFIGDGVMALFNSGERLKDNSIDALKAATVISEKMAALSRESEEDFQHRLGIGIGIHAGTTIMGEMGYGTSISETAIGDCVNVASRLEQLTKAEGCELIISEDLYLSSGVIEKPMSKKTIPIKGKANKMSICTFDKAQFIIQ
tara:strand:- start:229 stop:1653 length:1425 start_codon:yes stop_codon:yes gene_type:complete